MQQYISRRSMLGLLGCSAILPFAARLVTAASPDFRIRTLTAGVRMLAADNLNPLEKAVIFLEKSREDYHSLGFEVQTLRLATQPLFDYLRDQKPETRFKRIRQMDDFAREHNVMLALGPVNNVRQESEEFAAWLVELIANTTNTSCSIAVASKRLPPRQATLLTAGSVMSGIAKATKGGEGNFRFVATACCPQGIPFFPAAWFTDESFSIGLESPDLLLHAIEHRPEKEDVKIFMKRYMQAALKPVEKLAISIAQESGRPYLGIDTSPAPNLDVSIGHAIEALSAVPFGSPGTLAACATITDVLKSLEIKSCGYSGLMLPVLEDKRLAERAGQGKYRVSDLLLFSAVCGTGLDVVPLAGDTSAARLAALVGDVAALAMKYNKPLSARLFPVPQKKAGDIASFDNPFLTDSPVMKLE